MNAFNRGMLVLTFCIVGIQSLSARRMETSLYVKQTLDNQIGNLEQSINALEESKNFQAPGGATALPLSPNQIKSIDDGIAKLRASITLLRS